MVFREHHGLQQEAHRTATVPVVSASLPSRVPSPRPDLGAANPAPSMRTSSRRSTGAERRASHRNRSGASHSVSACVRTPGPQDSPRGTLPTPDENSWEKRHSAAMTTLSMPAPSGDAHATYSPVRGLFRNGTRPTATNRCREEPAQTAALKGSPTARDNPAL